MVTNCATTILPVNPVDTVDPVLDLRAELLRRGFSIAEFARRHGYRRHTVRAVIRRHVGGECKTIRGAMAQRILADIEAIIGADGGKDMRREGCNEG